jgi:hypothetical protein
VNESDLFMQPPVLEPYRSRLEARYRRWAGQQDLSLGQEVVDFTQPDAHMARFFQEILEGYYQE